MRAGARFSGELELDSALALDSPFQVVGTVRIEPQDPGVSFGLVTARYSEDSDLRSMGWCTPRASENAADNGQARNQEKTQSILCRFRELQAAELGLATCADTRPRMASACTSLRACERGAAARDQPQCREDPGRPGLSDYEVCDLNDEINTQLREKRRWEMQIVALGGANYAATSPCATTTAGRCRGRKDTRIQALPGVRELFKSRNQDEDAEAHYAEFAAQPAEYFGDADEGDGALRLSEYERKAEDEGARRRRTSPSSPRRMVRSPPLPTAREVEGVLLALWKRALVEEYFGGEEEETSSGGEEGWKRFSASSFVVAAVERSTVPY
ncbi:Isy1-like splicing family-domain-containing protein [Mycena vulgaris]|nr:Isy1-like splicing family-domain-containing protein [Mycena vulgaris]